MDPIILKKVQNFFSEYETREYKKGELIIRSYDNPKKVNFILDGYVKMYSISKNGKEFVLNTFKPTSFFPMSLAVNTEQNLYFYEALTPVKVKQAPTKKVLTFVKSNSDVMFDLLQRLYKGIDGLLIKLDFAMTSDAKSRLIVELITQAKRFGKKNKEHYELNISVNSLATTVGLARETVSRELKTLKDKRLISIKNKKILIFDLDKLVEEIN